jgi:hypothetical protein
MHTIQINNAVWKEGDYYAAQCLNVDVSSFGDTKMRHWLICKRLLSCILKIMIIPRLPQ